MIRPNYDKKNLYLSFAESSYGLNIHFSYLLPDESTITCTQRISTRFLEAPKLVGYESKEEIITEIINLTIEEIKKFVGKES